jgi:hypothetical protein
MNVKPGWLDIAFKLRFVLGLASCVASGLGLWVYATYFDHPLSSQDIAAIELRERLLGTAGPAATEADIVALGTEVAGDTHAAGLLMRRLASDPQPTRAELSNWRDEFQRSKPAQPPLVGYTHQGAPVVDCLVPVGRAILQRGSAAERFAFKSDKRVVFGTIELTSPSTVRFVPEATTVAADGTKEQLRLRTLEFSARAEGASSIMQPPDSAGPAATPVECARPAP